MSFLIIQNNIPNTVTGLSPTEVLYKYKPKMLIDVANMKKKVTFDSTHSPVSHTNIHGGGIQNRFKSKSGNKPENQFVNMKSNKQIMNCSELKNNRFNFKIHNKFKVGDIVLYRNHFKESIRWIPAIVKEIVSKTTYLISLNDYIRYVHENKLKISSLNEKYHPNHILAPSARDSGVQIQDDKSVKNPVNSPTPIECPLEGPVKTLLKTNTNLELKNSSKINLSKNKKSLLKKPKIKQSHKPTCTCTTELTPKKKRVRRVPDRYN